MAVSHVFTNANADGTNVSVVRPSDWNSAHVQAITLEGNTAGVSSITGTNIVFGGSNNVTLSGVQGVNAGTINISAANGGVGGGSVNVSAGTTSNDLSNFAFADGNGVSFGLNGSTITATVRTDYQSAGAYLTTAQPVGAYLTTARASNDAVGLNTAQSNVTWTVNSSGLSLDARGYAGTATGATNASLTVNSAGVSVSVGNYLTTARASNDAIGLNTAQSNVTWTANSSGLSLDARGYAGTATTFNGANLSGSMTVNSNGVQLSMSAGNYLTSQSNQAVSANNGSYAFQTLSFSNANGISFGTSAGSAITASHNALTTARASTDAIGLNTAQSNVTWTVNSSGLSLDARGYAGTGTTFNGANVSGSMTVNSVGVQLSLSAGAAGGTNLTAYAQSNTTQSSSGTIALSSLNFAGAGIASVGVSNGSVIVSVPAGGGGGDGGVSAGVSNLGNTLGSTGIQTAGNFVLVGTNGITLSQSTAAGNATVTISGDQFTIGGWEPNMAGNNTTFSSMGQNTLYLQKVVPDENYSCNNFEFRMSGSFASSTNSQVVVHTIRYGLYSLNTANNSYSSIGSSSIIYSASYNSNTAMGYTISQGAGSYTTTSGGTAIASLMTGVKHIYLPFTTTLTPGVPYGIAFHISSASTGSLSAHRMSILNQTIMNNLTIGKVFASSIVASNASHVGDYEQGVLSVTTAALPAAIAKSDMTLAVSQARLYVQLDA